MKKMMYLDKKSLEIENIINGSKDVIMRGANIKKYPFKMIQDNDRLYLLQNDQKDVVYVSARVKKSLFFEVESKENLQEILSKYQDRVKLSSKKLNYIKERKYVSIFEIDDIKIENLRINHSLYGIEEDWIRLEKLDNNTFKI